MKYIQRSLLVLALLAVALGVPAPAAATSLEAEQFLSTCSEDDVVHARPRLCNTTAQPGRFEVGLAGLPAGASPAGFCRVAGPTSFRLRQAQPVLVPARSCVDLEVEVGRPSGLSFEDTTCFGITAKDVGSSQTYQSQSLISASRSVCAAPSNGTSSGLPFAHSLPMAFTVRNTQAEPLTFRYRIEALENPGEDPVVVLDGGAAGEAVEGQVVIPANSHRLVATEVGLAGPSDSRHQLVLSNRDSDLQLASRSFTSEPAAACVAGDTTLCLNGDRFEVKAAWRDFAGNTGAAHAGAMTEDTGYFWFFSPNNVELAVKVLDARHLNSNWWVYFGALSTVEYTIAVRDTFTGESKSYYNSPYSLTSVGDIGALPGYDPTPDTLGSVPELVALDDSPGFSREVSREAVLQPEAGCTTEPDALCVQNRFLIQVDWTTAAGDGQGKAHNLTADSGYFWFFSPNNVEIVIKVLDGQHINDHWWIMFGALSDVSYTVVVTDTVTGNSNTYHNQQGHLASIADFRAFE